MFDEKSRLIFWSVIHGEPASIPDLLQFERRTSQPPLQPNIQFAFKLQQKKLKSIFAGSEHGLHSKVL